MKTRLTAATATLAVLALAGCGTGAATDSATGNGAGGQGGNRVRLAMLQPPRSGLSPLSDDAFKLSRWNTAESLVGLDEQGLPTPELATSWEQRNDREWVFTLRPGVTFHDGTPLDAEAAARSLNTAAKASPTPRILDGVDLTAKAEGDTLVVTTGAKDPLLPNRLSSPQLVVLSAAAYQTKAVNPVGTGTGPFVLTAVNGTSSATLDRFDTYWGTKAAAAGIDAAFVPDGTARAAALRTGEADIVEAVPVGQAPTVEADLLHEVAMPRTNSMQLNTERGVFTDPAMRAAARAAITGQTIVDRVYEGHADAGQGLLGPAMPWAAEAREKSGAAQTLATYTDRAELPEVAVQVQQMLESAGFTVTMDVREYQYMEADALDGAFDAVIFSRAMLLDSGDPVATLMSDYSCDGGLNISHLCDPAIDTLLTTASAATPGPERHAATIAAETAILGTDAVVPLVHERVIQGETAQVTGAIRDPRERELVSTQTAVQ